MNFRRPPDAAEGRDLNLIHKVRRARVCQLAVQFYAASERMLSADCFRGREAFRLKIGYSAAPLFTACRSIPRARVTGYLFFSIPPPSRFCTTRSFGS